jgi:hypothetical protein
MQTSNIDKETINKITRLAAIRERAFFTIMRQTGLNPLNIKKLKVRDIENNKECPCKIYVSQEQLKGKFKEYPIFIGKEARNYLTQYLKTRENLTANSLLFTSHTNPEKEINIKDVSRNFKLIVIKKIRFRTIEEIKELRKLKLFDLIKFYRDKTKEYYKHLRNANSENEDLCRKIYEEKAMPYLEIEEPIIIEIKYNKKRLRKEFKELSTENKTMKQTIAKDNQFISEILTLIYNNNGDPETGENEKIGREFIALWKEVQNKQYYLPTYVGFQMPFEWLDIVEELSKTLKEIKKPYEEFETRYKIDLSIPYRLVEPNEARRIETELQEFSVDWYKKRVSRHQAEPQSNLDKA